MTSKSSPTTRRLRCSIPSRSTRRKAHSQGAELEARLRATSELEITGSIGLLEAEYDADAPAAGVSEGNSLPRSPESSYGISFNYKPRFEEDSPLSLRAEYLWLGDEYLTADNQADGLQDGYGLINGRVAWEFGIGGWSRSGARTWMTRPT